MGTLDNVEGAEIKRKIALIDVSAYSASQLVNYYNTNYGDKGWRIIQIIEISATRFVLAEKELG